MASSLEIITIRGRVSARVRALGGDCDAVTGGWPWVLYSQSHCPQCGALSIEFRNFENDTLGKPQLKLSRKAKKATNLGVGLYRKAIVAAL